MSDATIDQGYAAWLKSENLIATVPIDGAAKWPTQATEIKVLSPFSSPAAAAEEGVRRAAFHAAPIVRDRAVVLGERRDLIGRCVQLTAAQLGYGDGAPVFVIGVDEQDNGTTVLTILRKLT